MSVIGKSIRAAMAMAVAVGVFVSGASLAQAANATVLGEKAGWGNVEIGSNYTTTKCYVTEMNFFTVVRPTARHGAASAVGAWGQSDSANVPAASVTIRASGSGGSGDCYFSYGGVPGF